MTYKYSICTVGSLLEVRPGLPDRQVIERELCQVMTKREALREYKRLRREGRGPLVIEDNHTGLRLRPYTCDGVTEWDIIP